MARIVSDGDTVRLDVEIASTRPQHEAGLMERADLDESAGMLFLFDEVQDPQSGFWMYRTRIPLDAAFMDADGRIVAIRSMTPCPHDDQDDCEKYIAGVPWHMALEVTGGFFARHGIEVGAVFHLDPPDSR